MLRQIAEGIAEYIRADEYLSACGNISVVVEDKAAVGYEVTRALGGVGVLVLISVVGFRRNGRPMVVAGDIEFQISCFEHPELNRAGLDTPTAQGVAEHLSKILHYHRFPFLVGQFIFKDAGRDDVEEANIVRSNYSAYTQLGFEDTYFSSAATAA